MLLTQRRFATTVRRATEPVLDEPGAAANGVEETSTPTSRQMSVMVHVALQEARCSHCRIVSAF